MSTATKILLIGAAALAYVFSKKNTTLEEELEKLRNRIDQGLEDVIDYTEERTKDPQQLIKDCIKIKPYLDFGEFEGDKWSVQLTWKIENTSSEYVYVITGIKSILTILGYTCKFWMPGNDKNFVTLKPGEKIEIKSQKDIIMLYDEPSVRQKIHDKYWGSDRSGWQFKGLEWDKNLEAADYLDGLEAATYLRVQSIYGQSVVVSYGQISGGARKIRFKNGWEAVYFNNKEGRNMVGEDL